MESNTNSETNRGGESSTEDNSNKSSIKDDIDYYQRELIQAKNARKAFDKDPSNWTSDDHFAANIYKDIDDFDIKSLDSHIKDNQNKLKEALNSIKKETNTSSSIKRNPDYTPQESLVKSKSFRSDESSNK
jgi:hypothetical protein